MTFDDYQKKALKTAVQYDNPMIAKTIWAMGVAGEAGEVIEKWKKIIAYNDGQVSDEDLKELSKELGDVVWYVAVLAHTLNLSFNQIMEDNIKKLADRQKRNVIKGQGNDR
ncbi:MAG: nucleoside triphosphate pyrophosphohydrolase family protein [Candidatus Saccharimonadales bacterium]